MRKISSPDHRLKRGQGINDDIFSNEKKNNDNIEKKNNPLQTFSRSVILNFQKRRLITHAFS